MNLLVHWHFAILLMGAFAAVCARSFGLGWGSAISVPVIFGGALYTLLSSSATDPTGATIFASIFGLPIFFAATCLGLLSGHLWRQHKRRPALLALAPLLAYWLGNEFLGFQRANEIRRVEEFVRSNPTVIATVGENASASVHQYTGGAIALQYEVYVHSKEVTTYAIVDVMPFLLFSKFRLACVTPVSSAYRDPFADPCTPA